MNKMLPRLIDKLTKTRFPIKHNSQQVLHVTCNYTPSSHLVKLTIRYHKFWSSDKPTLRILLAHVTNML